MLSWIITKTVGTLRETYDLAEKAITATAEEISEIPNAISKGWEHGLSTPEEPVQKPTESTTAPRKFGQA